MDEYDSVGNWISGQWLGLVANNAVGYFNKLYTATSNLVSKISVQTYLTANATGTAYVDNVDLHNLSATASATPTVTVTGTPSVTPSVSPTATPSAQNMALNGSFEAVSAGFADNWTRDTNGFTIDTSSKGNNGANSAQVTLNTVSNHLFSSLITIPSITTYTWSQYTKSTNIAGEFGYYIDEYDNLGNLS